MSFLAQIRDLEIAKGTEGPGSGQIPDAIDAGELSAGAWGMPETDSEIGKRFASR